MAETITLTVLVENSAHSRGLMAEHGLAFHIQAGRESLLGGMHLLAASPERMARTVEALRQKGVQRLGPAHCTGAAATARLWHAFPQACAACSTGSRFAFQR